MFIRYLPHPACRATPRESSLNNLVYVEVALMFGLRLTYEFVMILMWFHAFIRY